MSQLKMYRLPGIPVEQFKLPSGYSVSNYKGKADKKARCVCCRNGGLINDDGGRQMEIPNLRNPDERKKWRNDTRCTDPAVAGDMLLPSYSKGNPDIPQKNYDYLAALPSDRHVDSETRRELNIPSNIFD